MYAGTTLIHVCVIGVCDDGGLELTEETKNGSLWAIIWCCDGFCYESVGSVLGIEEEWI